MTSKEGHGRVQSLLLVSKILDFRDNVSPFTLVLDSLEQSAKSLIKECILRLKLSKSRTIYISYETLRPPESVDKFIAAHRLNPATLQQQIKSATSTANTRYTLIFDTVHILALDPTINIASYLSSLITPSISLLCVFHTDLPLPPVVSPSTHRIQSNPYNPKPVTLLKFLATTIFTLYSFSHTLAEKAARERSVAAPIFGVEEDEEGVIQGLGSNDPRGFVLEMEHRRRSGRAVGGLFFVVASEKGSLQRTILRGKRHIMHLNEHSLYKRSDVDVDDKQDMSDVTFNLSLTEKQRRDREGVVLPYFDAQTEDGGVGEGGRILYNMGKEDDFDEEEDEI